ncbi:MAG: hypothetical protein NTY17_17035 [Planctomycetia bacterium]|nr:hypothetical protein [Planctomycetia bacterium]
MSQKLSDFSPAKIYATYRCIGLEITVRVQGETAHPPASPDAFPKIFRTPHQLIDEIVVFKTRHAQACVDRLSAMPGIAVPDPWDQAAEDQLLEHIRAVVGRIRKLVDRKWPVEFPLVDIVQERAEQELRQRISEEFEAGRIAYWAAKNGHIPAAFSNELQATPTSAPAQDPSQFKAHKPRGKSTGELLGEHWRDPKKRQQLLNAGSAERIGKLIGKSATAVKEAGPIWTDKIAPWLKSVRVVATATRRSEERFDG